MQDRNFLTGSLVDGNVVEARMNFKRSYLWLFRNLRCGDLIGGKGIEKELVHVSPGLV